MELSNSAAGESHREESNYVYEWTIRNFKCSEVRAEFALPSIDFKFNLCANMAFNGTLSLVGNSCPERQLHLCLRNSSVSSWKVYCKLSFGDKKTEFYYNSRNNFTQVTLYDSKSKTYCLIPHDHNIITCEVSLVKYISISCTTVAAIKKSKFLNDFARLFDTKNFSDVTFEVGGKELRAHKNILACRSDVFGAMFEHQMKESETNKVVIEDIEPEVFEELLRFIYTDNVSNLEQMATKLLVASDKYNLTRLKSMCEKELAENISVENAAEIWIVADLLKAIELKRTAKTFIVYNRKAVAATKGWQDIIQNHSNVLAEFFMESVI